MIVKALKSEFGDVRIIPQNMEKYLSITVDRLKLIDSLQFTSQSLVSLVKALEVDEFKYVREAFPIAHEFELIKRAYPYDDAEDGYIFEVDLSYPQHLHDDHDDYPDGTSKETHS